jgi:hypothetical protein
MRHPNTCAGDFWRPLGHYRRPAVPRGGQGGEFSHLLSPGEQMRTPIVGKLRQAHTRGRDEGEARGLAHKYVQAIMQLRSKRRYQDPERDHILTPHFIMSVGWGPDVAKVRSPADLCGLRVKVETYTAPKGPLQCKRCQRFGHTQSNCGYAPRCVACGHAHPSGRVRPQSSSLNAAAAGATTLPTIAVAVSGRRQGRPLQSARKGSAARKMASPHASRHPNRPS